MKTQTKKSIIPQIILSSLIAAVITAGIVSAATTIGNNISTDGTLSATGLTIAGNASTTQMFVSSNLYLTALTAKSIPYIGTSGLLTQDISNFVWDGTNNRLGIGTSSPYAKLSVVGETVAEYFTATSTTATTTLAGGFAIETSGLVYDYSSNDFWVDTNTLYVDSSASRVGVGTAAPSVNLEVKGSGTTVGTSGFLVTDNNGTRTFEVQDNGSLVLGGAGAVKGEGDILMLIDSNNNDFSRDFVVAHDSNTTVNYLMVVREEGEVGIGTSSPATLLDVYSIATSTITVDSSHASRGSCLKLKDMDGSGYTYCYVNGGTMTCSTVSCE